MISFMKNIFLLILFWNLSLFAHDFHMSYGESVLTIKEFKGKITFYKDDFFKGLRNFNTGNFKNFQPKDYDKIKNEYLAKHFQVVINKKSSLPLNITDNNEDASSIWFSFSFKSEEEIKTIKIIFSILFNEYSDQMNILNIDTPNGEESKIFKESKPEIEINI